MRILVTGANGFVGRALVPFLSARGYQIVALEGKHGTRRDEGSTRFHSIDLTLQPDLTSLLDGADAVIHLAGKAHSRDGASASALAAYRRANTEAVIHLAGQAVRSGVKRFVLLSSIHVNGGRTDERPFTETSPSRPLGAYGTSKHEGEQGLISTATDGAMEWCIIRPSMIVGGSTKANLASLLRLVGSGLPLPFRAIANRRSIVGRDNLCAFIDLCVTHPKAANELFLIADDPPLSTAELVVLLASSLGRSSRQFAMPALTWKLLGTIPAVERRLGPLWESLEVDSAKARNLLGWRQPRTTASAISEAAEGCQA